MDEDVIRKMLKSILTLALTTIATWLAAYITNKILGPEELPELEEA